VTLLLAAPLATEVQQAGRVYRVGFLSLGARPAQHRMWHTLLEAMRELNYVEGQNLIVSIAFAEGKPSIAFAEGKPEVCPASPPSSSRRRSMSLSTLRAA
jgi:hypothetical protein